MRSVESFVPGPREEWRRDVQPRDEINVTVLTDLFWRGRLLLSLLTLFAGAAALTLALILPKQYQARIVISPATKDTRESGIGSSLQQLSGGLAALAGFGGVTNTFKAESLATLESEVLTESYIREQNLLPILFAGKWDAVKQAWRPSDPRKWPTVWQANQFFSKSVRSVVDDKKSGLVVLTITWKDPAVAAKWANDLVARTNEYMRRLAIEDAQRNMDYLKDQVEKNPTMEMRQTIYTLMEIELKNAMLAQGNRQFALKVIDPATVPEKPVSPKPAVWAVAGLMLGFLVGACTLLLRAGRANSHEAR